MTAASVALFPLFAGPMRTTRVLGIVPGAVYLQIDPLAAADSRDHKDHPGAVIALLEPEAARLPFGIVLPAAASGLVPISVAGAPVSRGEIKVGWGSLDLAGTRYPVLDWWNPGVPALLFPPRSLSAHESLSDPDDAALPFAVPIELADGLAALALGESGRAVRLLIGVGSGPTPAGDAVLCGALAALAAWAPESPERQTLAETVVLAVEGTTAMSAALLQSAIAGFAIPELGRVLTALSIGDQVDVEAAVGALGRVETIAGAAMAAGAVQQFRWLSRGARKVA